MSAPRTVTIRTADHGPVTVPEPSWCLGQHRDGGARVDITHAGPDVVLTVPTRSGPATVLVTALESAPFATDPTARGPIMAVETGGTWCEAGPAELAGIADALTAHADAVRARARDLAAALAEDRGQR